MVSLAFVSVSDVYSAGSQVFQLGETHPKGYPTEMADEYFAQLVKERSRGRIVIEVFPENKLGEEKVLIEKVQQGTVGFTRVSTAPMAEFSKQFGVFSLPYIFDDKNHMWKFLSSSDGQKILDSLTSSNFVGLCYYDGGARSFYSTKPIKKFQDLKGLRFRTLQNKQTMEMMASIGAKPVPMAYGEVFNALKNGTIDGAENNFPSYESSKHYQIAKYFLVDHHLRIPEVLVVNKSVWNKFSKDDQALIRQAAADSVKRQRELWDSKEQESETAVRMAGCTITEVRDLKSFQNSVKPMIESYKADFGDILKAIDKARSAKK